MPPLRQGATEEHPAPQITDVWHACQLDRADQMAANVYVGLVVLGIAFLLLWIAYRRDCKRY